MFTHHSENNMFKTIIKNILFFIFKTCLPLGYLFVFECYSIISNTSRHKRLFGIPLVSNITTILVFRVLVLLTPSIILSTLLQLYCRLLDTLPLFVDTSCISFINITINKQPYYIKYPYYNRLI